MEPKDLRACVPASIVKRAKNSWEAWPCSAGSHGVSGEGETEKAAREDLEKNLAWVAHYVGAFVAFDGEGAPWICTVAPYAGHWIVRRPTEKGLSEGTSVCRAPSFSALRDQIATWNRPQAAGE